MKTLHLSIIAIVCIVTAYAIWHFTSYDPAPVTHQNVFLIHALVIHNPLSTPSIGFAGTSHNYYLKFKSELNTCGLVAYNICDGNSCVKNDGMPNSLPVLDFLHLPDYQEFPLPDNLPWKEGDSVNIQVKVQGTYNLSDPSIYHSQNIWIDLGKSEIMSS